jgi:hypothetical protein
LLFDEEKGAAKRDAMSVRARGKSGETLDVRRKRSS